MFFCLLEGFLDDVFVECIRIWSNVIDLRYMYVVVEVCILFFIVFYINFCTGILEYFYLEVSSFR